MYKRLKVKIYPTFKQKLMLENHFNGYRYCYNLCLEYKSTLWHDYKKNISAFQMQKELFDIRKETIWLSKCKAECIRDAAFNVDTAYKNFFKGKGFPNFKNRKGIQSFSAYQAISCKENKIKFYGYRIKFKTSEKYNELLENHKIKQCTFKRDLVGDYWATLLIETKDSKKLLCTNKEVGVDLGIKNLAITSDGNYFENNRYLENSYYKLRRLQRKYSKTKKSGKNREKLRIRIAKLNRKLTRQKEHYYHKITNKILHDNQVIYIEDLSVKNMQKHPRLSRVISDVSWGMFIQMLEYKARWYGRDVIKISRFFPSSKTCSNCGNINIQLKLSDRIYYCNGCEISIDRDLNASINILKEGQKIAGIKIPGVPMEDANNSSSNDIGSKINI